MAAQARRGGPRWDQLKLAPVTLIRAGEEVPAERAVERLQRMARTADPNTEIVRIDAVQYEPKELAMHTSPSLFGEAKLLRVDHLEEANDALVADLKDYAEAPATDCMLIVVHHGGNRARGVLTAIEKAGHQVCTIEKAKYARDKERLVREEVAYLQGSMDGRAVAELVAAVGADTRELLAAVRQLVEDVDGTVTEADVRAYYAGRKDVATYDVADSAIAGDTGRAIALARHAIATGVQPVAIVAALNYKLRDMVGATDPKAPKGSNDWRARKAREAAARWSDRGMGDAILAVAQADAEVKGASRDPAFAVERAIIRIGRARRIRKS